ncbi:hypothetical protein HKCCE2091_06385 [Rhodobacterales bacterium HKCCE2091]|nr:hypothetical protein [Rhodobacterales bacterium HKCCE2091]
MTTQDTPATSRDSGETATDTVQGLRDDVVKGAKSLKDEALDEAAKRGNRAKDSLADEVSDIGNALRHAADELRTGSPQERTFGQMASALADVSDTVRDKDLGEIVGDLSDFARRNPLAFLGGAALLGFAGTRIARASRQNRENSVDLRHPWGSEEEERELDEAIVGTPLGTPHHPSTVPGRATAAQKGEL